MERSTFLQLYPRNDTGSNYDDNTRVRVFRVFRLSIYQTLQKFFWLRNEIQLSILRCTFQYKLLYFTFDFRSDLCIISLSTTHNDVRSGIVPSKNIRNVTIPSSLITDDLGRFLHFWRVKKCHLYAFLFPWWWQFMKRFLIRATKYSSRSKYNWRIVYVILCST